MKKKLTIQIPATRTYKDAAEWVTDDLYDSGADNDRWNDERTYELDSGARVKVSPLTLSTLAIMPTHSGGNGRVVYRHELTGGRRALTVQSIQLALMRADYMHSQTTTAA